MEDDALQGILKSFFFFCSHNYDKSVCNHHQTDFYITAYKLIQSACLQLLKKMTKSIERITLHFIHVLIYLQNTILVNTERNQGEACPSSLGINK